MSFIRTYGAQFPVVVRFGWFTEVIPVGYVFPVIPASAAVV